jgi:CMP-N,N'-diacetyllegionaminic acid synthase
MRMINGQKVLGLIPARGGSKGLPRKNIRELCGKPLIAWTIDTAHAAHSLDAVVVSTDDAEIAAVAIHHGAEVPFLRPAELAGDTASSIDVLIHAIDTLAAVGRQFDIVVLLEPTSPLREPSDIDGGLAGMLAADAGAIVSVCLADAIHPVFMYRLGVKDRLVPFLDRQPSGLRRQETEPLFYLEGTLYASRTDVLRAQRSFYHQDTAAWEVPKWKAIEIDDLDDFLMTEALAKHKGLG